MTALTILLQGIVIPLLFLNLLACSHKSLVLVHEGEASKVALKHLNALCFTGEGRGRIHWSKQKYAFAYESLLGPRFWELAVSFPFQSPLLLKLQEARPPRGSFYHNLQKNLPHNSWEKRQLNRIFRQLGWFGHTLYKIQQGDSAALKKCQWQGPSLLTCSMSQAHLQWALTSGHITLDIKGMNFRNEPPLQMKLSNFNGQYFQKISINMVQNKATPKGQMKLFVKSCEGP